MIDEELTAEEEEMAADLGWGTEQRQFYCSNREVLKDAGWDPNTWNQCAVFPIASLDLQVDCAGVRQH